MGFRFRKSVKIAPGVKLNIGKKSAGVSVGGKYGGVSYNSKTGTRVRASAPGTGVSYSSKVGGGNSGKTQKGTHGTGGSGIQPSKLCPTPRKTWYIVIAVLFVVSGVLYLPKGILEGIITLAIGAIMLFFTFKSPKPIKINFQLFNRHLQIFDESVKIFMSTALPETFFGRYSDAEMAANAMASMTDAPLVHDEPPQEAVAMLERDKTNATNAFLDRYAGEIRKKAFELTRGRKAKIDSFKLITDEYKDKMTNDSIIYRDKLYIEMCSKLEEVEKT